MGRKRLWAGLVCTALVAGALAVTPSSGIAQALPNSVEGMRILLVNDDSVQATSPLGLDGKGLYEMRKALCAAGADVIAVGPWAQQSGVSARIASPGSTPVPLTVAAAAPPAGYAGDCTTAPSGGGLFGVCQAVACDSTSPSASPSDATLLALGRFLPDNYWPTGPDLVVSGANFGQNVGQAVNHSGTVGAVVSAMELGKPAIAFSAEFDFGCAPNPFDCVPFAQTGAFAVELIGGLRAANQFRVKNFALNVNYPALRPGETLGAVVPVKIGTGTNIGFDYSGTVGAGGGTYNLIVGSPVPETLKKFADTTELNNNNIVVTRLDGNWGKGTSKAIKTVLAGL
jgi:5'-nucleotidase